MNILKSIVDLVYRTKAKRYKFEKQSGEKVLAADGSKGIIVKSNDGIHKGKEWITAQRSVILLTEKQIICGKWNIPLKDISQAKLTRINSSFSGGTVLSINTAHNKSYQFGMEHNIEWYTQKVMPFTTDVGKAKKSLFNWVVQIIAIGFLVYYICFYKGGI